MTPLVQECYRIGAHLAARLEDAARSLDPSILEAIAVECEGAARVLRRHLNAEVLETGGRDAMVFRWRGPP